MSTRDTLDFAPVLITEVFESVRQAPSWLNTNQVSPGAHAHPHVTNSALRNSVSGFISGQRQDPNPGNAITIGVDTQVVAYQPVSFYAATKVMELRAPELSASNALVLVALLRKAIEKFSWGHKASVARIARTRVMIPVIAATDGGMVVDWSGMSKFGEELRAASIARITGVRRIAPLVDASSPSLAFTPMLITEVFESMRASTAWYDKSKLSTTGEVLFPFVSRTRAGNGIDGFCAVQDKEPEPGNAVTIGLDTQTVAYQPVAFYTSQNIQVLRHPRLTTASGAVLVTIIQQQMGKFSWGGNGATLGRLRRTRIMVPTSTGANGDHIVDWDGMAAYGRALRVTAERGMSTALNEVSP